MFKENPDMIKRADDNELLGALALSLSLNRL
jgi:hypothetical protein